MFYRIEFRNDPGHAGRASWGAAFFAKVLQPALQHQDLSSPKAARIRIYVNIYIYRYRYRYMHIHVYIYIYICNSIFAHASMHKKYYVRLCTYICVYVYICIHV